MLCKLWLHLEKIEKVRKNFLYVVLGLLARACDDVSIFISNLEGLLAECQPLAIFNECVNKLPRTFRKEILYAQCEFKPRSLMGFGLACVLDFSPFYYFSSNLVTSVWETMKFFHMKNVS